MALLDLQVLDASEPPSEKRPKGSRASKACDLDGNGGGSTLSILLCHH